MKKSLPIIIALLFSFNAFCQSPAKNVNIKWGPTQKGINWSLISGIVAHDNSGIYVLRIGKKSAFSISFFYQILHFDNQMKLVKTAELNMGDNLFNGITEINHKIYLFTTNFDKKLKRTMLYAQTINKKSLNLNPKGEQLASIDQSAKGTKVQFKNFRDPIGDIFSAPATTGIHAHGYETTHFSTNRGKFAMITSKGSTKLLVFNNLPCKGNDEIKFEFHVLNSNMKLLWKKEVTLPYKQKHFTINNYLVDNSGNVFLTGTLSNKDTSSCHILGYFNNGNELKQYHIKLQDTILTDMRLAITDQNNLICAGLYSTKKSAKTGGAFFIKISGKTKAITVKSFKKFSVNFITQNMQNGEKNRIEKKTKKGKNIELRKFDLNNIITRNDGGVVLIGEQYYLNSKFVYENLPSGQSRREFRYYINFNDIIVINILPDGKIEWAKKIGKEQHIIYANIIMLPIPFMGKKQILSTYAPYSSYSLLMKKNSLYFIFNDNIKNIAYTDISNTKDYVCTMNKKKTIPMIVKIDKTGKETKNILFAKDHKSRALIAPILSAQYMGNNMALFEISKKGFRYGDMTIK